MDLMDTHVCAGYAYMLTCTWPALSRPQKYNWRSTDANKMLATGVKELYYERKTGHYSGLTRSRFSIERLVVISAEQVQMRIIYNFGIDKVVKLLIHLWVD